MDRVAALIGSRLADPRPEHRARGVVPAALATLVAFATLAGCDDAPHRRSHRRVAPDPADTTQPAKPAPRPTPPPPPPPPPPVTPPPADPAPAVNTGDSPLPDQAVRVDRFHPTQPTGPAPANRCPGPRPRAGEMFLVRGVDQSDVLNIRAEPDWQSEILGKLSFDMTGVVGTGERQRVGGSTWRKIRCGDVSGWVNEKFLSPARP